MAKRTRLRGTKAQTTNAVHRLRERKREEERGEKNLLFARIAECPLGAEGAVSRDWERGTARSFRRCCFPF